ncbi:MAG TPA: hypothetical protein VLL51_10900 [Gemmatimonadales bacterium]|nr:hypothetical protein [Gemmatimonadales bacterium]
MEDILAIIFLFGGGTAVLLSFSPLGRAMAERIRGRHALAEPHPEVLAEIDQLRQELTEVQERLDFTERLLTRNREADQLASGEGGAA